MKIIALLLPLLLFLPGCAPNVRPVQFESIVVNAPEVGEAKKGELGDTLVSKTIKTELETIEVYNSVDFVYFTAPAGTYAARWEGDSGIYYGADNAIVNNFGGKRWTGGFLIPFGNRNSQKDVTVWLSQGQYSPPTGINPTDGYITFTRGKATATGQPYFKQELIYNGKSGNNIKFLYRELSNNRMRAPFTQDIQYDLNESKTIGFKGARIDIIKATNRQIEYIVRKPFP